MAGSAELLSPWPCEPTVNMCTTGILPVDNSEHPVNEQASPFVVLLLLRLQKTDPTVESAPSLRLSSTRILKSASPTVLVVGAPPKRLCAV